MPGVCPLCGATLNLGLKFCVVCGRSATGDESSKMGGIKTGVRQADSTSRIDADEALEAAIAKGKRPLRFRHVRSLYVQLIYIFIGLSLFFCAIRYILDTVFPGRLQRTVHTLQQELKKMPVSKMIPPQIQKLGDQLKPPPPKKKKRRRH